MRKKLLSIILAALMVVSLMPTVAFADGPYLVTAQVQGDHGTAEVKDSEENPVTEAAKDTELTFTATANEGYKFDYWEVVSGGVNIEATKTNNPITVTMPDTALTLKAHFKPITYTVIFHRRGGSQGDDMPDQTMTYDVAAHLSKNKFLNGSVPTFVGWTTDEYNETPIVYGDYQTVKNLANTQDAKVNLYASWRKSTVYAASYPIDAQCYDGGRVSKAFEVWETENGQFPEGSTATANEGYFFKGWKDSAGHFITETKEGEYDLSDAGKTIKPSWIPQPEKPNEFKAIYTAVFVPFVTVSGVSMNKTDFTYGDKVGRTGTPVATTKEGVDVTSKIQSWTYTYFQNNGTADTPNWVELNSDPANVGSYKLVVEAKDDDSDYKGKLELPFTISKKAVTVSGIAVKDKTYNGKTDDATIVGTGISFNGKLESDTLTISGITGTYESADAGDSREVTLNASSNWTLGGESAANYKLATEGQPTSVTGKISKATPNLADVSATAITYGQKLANSTVTGTATNENMTENKTVAGTFAFTTGDTTPAVSDSENTTYGVTFTPTDGTNYNTSTTEIKLKVNKADYAEVIKTASGNLKAKKDSTAEITLPSKPINTSYGAVTNNNTVLYTINETNKASGKLTLTAAKDFDKTTESGDTTFTVAVVPDRNHNGYDITVTVTPVFKTLVSITAEADGFTYGDSGKTGYKNVTVQDSLVDVNTLAATYYLADGTTKTNTTEGASVEGGMPANAGTYKVVLSVPDSNETYTGSKTVEFTVAKKAVTIKPNDKSAYVGDTKPELGQDEYTVTGLINGDTLATAPALNYEIEPDMTKAGTVAIKASGANVESNYEIAYVDGTLTISNKPSSGGGSSSTVTVPVTGDENTVKVSATVSGSTATVKKIADADLEKVTEGESVSIDLSAVGKNVDTAKIPTETVEKIAEKSSLTIKLPVATVEFDKAATEEIADQAKGSNIELVVDDIKEVSLNAVQKEAVKKLDTAIIIDAHLASNGSRLCTADNGGFGGGSAKVILPYEIKNNRKPENYSVFYVNDAGKLEKLNAVYDEELKAFVFEIEHFSVYAVAFEQFVDIDANAYYYDAVKWAASNGITDGTDSTHFSPNGITNRGQMVTFLWRAAGKPEPTLTECPFTDVKAGSYYYKAVLWAYEKGITDGTTATTFEPDKNVSRAQTVTFLWRYAGKPVLDYWMQMTDVASGKYYTEAVRWALAEGITDGTSKTTFSPNDDCLRGQIVTFLYRSLVK